MSGRYLSLVLLFGLAALVAITSPGFDDEFHNVRGYLAAADRGGLIAYWSAANDDPVHPAGSYLISFALQETLQSWPLVRLAKTTIGLSVLYLSLMRLFPHLHRRPPVDWIALAIVTPSFLMWCTGLRWFGEFSAVLALIVAIDRFVPYRSAYFVPVLAALLALLGSLNYLGFLFLPALLAFHFLRWKAAGSSSRSVAFATAMVAIPTFALLAAEPLAHGGDQTAAILPSLVGVGHGVLVNHGVFPFSAIGVVTAATTLSFFLLALFRRGPVLFRDDLFWLLLALIALIALSGLGAKFRNVTPVLPLLFAFSFQSLAISPPLSPKLAWVQRLLIALLLATNALGAYNVVTHRNTAKGSWNLPVSEILAAAHTQIAACDDPLVVVWDPVLEFHFWQRNIKTAALRFAGAPEYPRASDAFSGHDCSLLVQTTPGSMVDAQYFVEAPDIPGTPVAYLGKDRFFAAKQRLGATAGPYYASIYELEAGNDTFLERYFVPSFYTQFSTLR